MKYILAFIFSLVCVVSSYTQTLTTDTTYVNNKFWVTGVRQELPEWLSKQSEEGNFVVGFSDSGVKPEFGKEQAIQRALFTYALGKGVEVRSVQEMYERTEQRTHNSREKISSKLSTVAVLYLLNRTYSYEIVREEQTDFGETILLMRVGEKGSYDNVASFSATVEIMEQLLEDRYETSYQNYTFTFESTLGDFEIEKSTQSGSFKNGKCTKYISLINNDTLSLPRKDTLYKKMAIANGGATSSKCYVSHLGKTFWNGFVSSLVQATMEAVVTSEKSTIKQLEETYQEGVSDIIRQVLTDTWSMKPRMIGILDQNHLMVEWAVQN